MLPAMKTGKLKTIRKRSERLFLISMSELSQRIHFEIQIIDELFFSLSRHVSISRKINGNSC